MSGTPRPPGIYLHPRTRPVTSAGIAIGKKLRKLQDKYDLTDIEMLQILTERCQVILRYMLRAERHPEDPEKKADEE